MVHVPASDGAYCIDSTEVTVAQYLAFLDAAALDATLLANQGAECAANTSFAPPAAWASIFADITQPSESNDPIRVVDHCDAKAFCRWSGKHLCGRRGGGTLGLAEVATTAGEWFHACSAGGTKVYPYGAQPSPLPGDWPNGPSGVCFDGQPAPPAGSYELWTEPVATNAGCEGGFPGIFDMSGNAYEWIDACDESSDPVRCAAIGGASHFDANATFCGFSQTFEASAPSQFIGFRCCATAD
jgi:formylglycine-generating enzyme required for sulfatase activity